MKTTKLLLIASIAAAAIGTVPAFADEADGSQNVLQVQSTTSRDQVNAELQQYKQAGVNPWSTSYNPLKSFHAERSRADVRAEYLRSRNEAAAFNGEDSGSAYLAQATGHQGATAATVVAGQPVNAQ